MGADGGSLVFRPCIDEHESGNPTYPRDLRVYKNTSDTTFDIYIQVTSLSYVDVEMTYSGSGITVYDTPTWEASEPTTSGTYTLEFTNGNLNAMKIDNDGNVGIGMTDPTSKLNVASTFDPASATDSATFDKYTSVITNTIAGPSVDADNTQMGIAFGNFGSNVFPNNVRTPGAAITHERVDSWSKGKLHFKTKGNTNFDGSCNTRMTIDENGRVGIGVTNPHTGLELYDNITFDNTRREIRFNNYYDNGWKYIKNGYAGNFRFENTGDFIFYTSVENTAGTDAAHPNLVPKMTIKNDGKVGIGKTDPTSNLHVVGDILASGNITAYSDRRLKSDIERIEGALDKVCALRGYTFTMNDKRSTGLIAQEVKEVLPEAVHGSEETHYSLAYGNVIGLIVEAIKELKEKVG